MYQLGLTADNSNEGLISVREFTRMTPVMSQFGVSTHGRFGSICVPAIMVFCQQDSDHKPKPMQFQPAASRQ